MNPEPRAKQSIRNPELWVGRYVRHMANWQDFAWGWDEKYIVCEWTGKLIHLEDEHYFTQDERDILGELYDQCYYYSEEAAIDMLKAANRKLSANHKQERTLNQMPQLLDTVDRFYYSRNGEGIYRLERAGQITQVVNPPGLIESPQFVLYNTLENERLSGITWQATGLELHNGYGWIFERSVTPNDDDTEPIEPVPAQHPDRKALLTRVWSPILLLFAATSIEEGDVVEMRSTKHGAYFGTVLVVDRATCRVKVEYFHPATREYWHGWRDYSEVTVIHKAKVAA